MAATLPSSSVLYSNPAESSTVASGKSDGIFSYFFGISSAFTNNKEASTTAVNDNENANAIELIVHGGTAPSNPIYLSSISDFDLKTIERQNLPTGTIFYYRTILDEIS